MMTPEYLLEVPGRYSVLTLGMTVAIEHCKRKRET